MKRTIYSLPTLQWTKNSYKSYMKLLIFNHHNIKMNMKGINKFLIKNRTILNLGFHCLVFVFYSFTSLTSVPITKYYYPTNWTFRYILKMWNLILLGEPEKNQIFGWLEICVLHLMTLKKLKMIHMYMGLHWGNSLSGHIKNWQNLRQRNHNISNHQSMNHLQKCMILLQDISFDYNELYYA